MSSNRRARIVLPLLCLALARFGAAAQEYHELYPAECGYAMEFYSFSPFLDAVADRSPLRPELLFAIVAPEVTQYRHLRDVVEQAALFALYTHSGRAYADFSIGIFQMKPSFIEELEEEIRKDDRLQELFPECVFSGEDTMPERRDRIKRLQSPMWQALYLALFAEIMEMRFAEEAQGEKEKLVLYATAYNSGFRKTKQELNEMSEKELFPRFSSKKYNYARLSLWFYDKLSIE